MKNLEEIKKEYRMFRERQYDIYKALDENANEYSEDYRKSIFGMFEDEDYREFILGNLDAYSDEIDPDNFDEEKIYEEYKDYLAYLGDILNRRLELYEENANWWREFNQWKKDEKIYTRFIQRDFDDCEKRYNGEWYGWGSNDLIFEGMMTTIEMTNEEEISKLVENANKVIKLIKEYEDEDFCYSEEYVDDLSYINTKIRYREFNDYCMHVYILDHLENDGMWEVYREPFQLFVDRVISWIDSDFLFAVRHCEK